MVTEDEMVEWHHQTNGHESEQILEDSEDREVWCAAIHRVARSWTQLSNRRITTTKPSKRDKFKKESFINTPAFTSQLGSTSDVDWGRLISAGLLFESIIEIIWNKPHFK